MRKIIVLTMLVFLSSGKALQFGFWKDDWISYWGAVHWSPQYYLYWFHPGTTIQFALFSFLFGPNVIGWQVAGLLWKVAAAYSIFRMITSLTHSRKIGLSASILFSLSPFGLDAVGWASATIVLVDVFFLCMTVSSWIHMLETSQNLKKISPYVWCILSLFVDPFRTFPIIIFILFLLLFYHRKHLVLKIFLDPKFFIAIILGIYLFITWQFPRVKETTIYQTIERNGNNVQLYLSKLYVVNNYFSTIGNMLYGIVVAVPEDLSTGIYNPIVARLSALYIVIFSLFVIMLKRIKNVVWFPLSFLFLWLLLFYLPNHLSEPRLTMGVTHRYATIASVGWIGIISIGLYSIRNRYISLFLFFILCFCSVQRTHEYLDTWIVFRSRNLLSTFWTKIDNDVEKKEERYIFVIDGDHQFITNVVNYSGATPFIVKRNYNALDSMPFPMSDVHTIINKLCDANVPILINNVYSWRIMKNETITNVSEQYRVFLRKKVLEKNICVISG